MFFVFTDLGQDVWRKISFCQFPVRFHTVKVFAQILDLFSICDFLTFFGGEENWRGVRTDQLSDPGSEDLKAGLCCVLAGAQALRCALRMWLC